MASQHAEAYQELGTCELVACADMKLENTQAFTVNGTRGTYSQHNDLKEELSLSASINYEYKFSENNSRNNYPNTILVIVLTKNYQK